MDKNQTQPPPGPPDPRRPWRAAHFLTYSNDTPPFSRNAHAFCESALTAGFASARHVTEDDLRGTPFWARHAGILEQPRGAGYWLWKPYIIRERLTQLKDDEVLIYSDAGRGLVHHLALFDEMRETLLKIVCLLNKGMLLGWSSNWAVQAQFTKGDCFHLMNANTEKMWNAPQIGATWSLWRPTPDAFKFLAKWQRFASDPRILTDLPDQCGVPAQPDLQRHLHDQAVMSILAHQNKAPFLKFHERSAKQEMVAVRSEAATGSDFLKRLPNVKRVVARLVPEGFSASTDPAAIGDCAGFVGYVDPRERVPDLSSARGGTPPGRHLSDLIRFARKSPRRIGWAEVHAGTPKAMRLVMRKVNDGLTRAQILAVRETLVKDVRAQLPLTGVTPGQERRAVRNLCGSAVMALARQMGLDLDDMRWPEFWRAMPPVPREVWRWTFLHVRPAELQEIRAEIARRFVTAQEAHGEAEAAFRSMESWLARRHRELLSGMSARSVFPAWWRIWSRMTPAQQGRWMDGLAGRGNLEVVTLQEALVAEVGMSGGALDDRILERVLGRSGDAAAA